jgi:hypothetical protein
MPELRTFELGDGRRVVTVRGDLDAHAVADLEAATAPCDGRVVVNLTDARPVDRRALEQLAVRVRATFVARRPLSDALEVIGLDVAPTLVAALG